MGTVVTQEVFGPRAERAARAALREIRRLEGLLSRFRPGSDISRLNRSAGRGPVKVCDETLEVLALALRVSEMSGGAFDVTSGPLVAAWAVTSERPAAPGAETLASLGALVGYRSLSIDAGARSACLERPGQVVDLGGIGKGFAADAAAKVYREQGVTSAVIDLGGNVMAIGTRPDGSPWNVGIQDPAAPRGECLAVIRTAGRSVVTSGSYERFFEERGARYHHLVNPATGYPAESGLLSATVTCQSSALADGLSTAAFVLGLEGGLDLSTRAGVDAVFVTTDRKVVATSGLKSSLIPAQIGLVVEFC